jgi:hypothetical protein
LIKVNYYEEMKCFFLSLVIIQLTVIGCFLIVWNQENPIVPNRLDEAKKRTENVSKQLNFEIWSKAAIGEYLWSHVLEASIDQNVGNGYYLQSDRSFDHINIRFRSGFSLVPNTFEKFVIHKVSESNTFPVNVMIVLNGRSKEHIQRSLIWLTHVQKLIATDVRIRDRLKVILLVLGHEKCFNAWLKPFLVSNGGFVRALLIVYDWKEVDDKEVFQWPLGVATYRGFPHHQMYAQMLKQARPFVCNFVGTVYPNTSRAELDQLYSKLNLKSKCWFKTRYEWQSNETNETLNSYIEALR